MSDIALPGSIEPAHRGPNLDQGINPLTIILYMGVIAAGLLRQRFPRGFWRWVHRLAYVAFGAAFVHSLLTGTDVAQLGISAIVCAVAAAVGGRGGSEHRCS